MPSFDNALVCNSANCLLLGFGVVSLLFCIGMSIGAWITRLFLGGETTTSASSPQPRPPAERPQPAPRSYNDASFQANRPNSLGQSDEQQNRPASSTPRRSSTDDSDGPPPPYPGRTRTRARHARSPTHRVIQSSVVDNSHGQVFVASGNGVIVRHIGSTIVSGPNGFAVVSGPGETYYDSWSSTSSDEWESE